PKPFVLCIWDGWGHRQQHDHNAIEQANTPAWHAMMRECPHALVDASELHVGLPSGQMGNSEVGHMNLGAGRVVMQDLPRIDKAIAESKLAGNPELTGFVAKLRAGKGACHILCLLPPAGLHAHP